MNLTAREKVRARRVPQGIAFASGRSAVTYTPKFAYVTTFSGPSSYMVDASSGALTPLPGSSPLPGRSVTVDPTSRFAYVASGASDVAGYTIDATSGALAPIAGSPFAAGRGTQSVAVDPSGRFAYVANFLDNTISGYTIDSTTGALIPFLGSPFPAGFAVDIAVDPTGRFAYVTNAGNGNVSGYMINAVSGALTLIPGSPFAGAPPCSSVFECSAQSSVAVDPTGRFAYVANHGSCTVSGYTINATTGALAPIAGSPFPAAAAATSVAVDPTGEFVYVTTPGGVPGYTINATTGALMPIAGSPFDTACVYVCSSVAVDPSGKFTYAVDAYDYTVSFSAGDVYGNAIHGTTGALTAIPGSPFVVGGVSTSIAVSGEIH